MNKKTKIELSDSLMDCLTKLSEGNPGAVTAIMELVTQSPKVDTYSGFGGFTPLLSLDSLGIYGSRIWLLYKDICGGDAAKVLTLLRAVQLGILSQYQLENAIDNQSDLPSFEETLERVRQQLPNFANNL